jgi:hypothetical protein
MEPTSPWIWYLALPGAILVVVIAASFILQGACALCNVEDLRFTKAVGLLFVLILANAPIGLVLFFLGQIVLSGWGWGKESVLTVFLVLGYPLHWLISGLVLFWPLHVSYLKGVLVSILNNVILVVASGIVGGLILVVLALVQLCTGSQ